MQATSILPLGIMYAVLEHYAGVAKQEAAGVQVCNHTRADSDSAHTYTDTHDGKGSRRALTHERVVRYSCARRLTTHPGLPFRSPALTHTGQPDAIAVPHPGQDPGEVPTDAHHGRRHGPPAR